MPSGLPILYSYRRCPYAMRARLALFVCAIPLEIREIELRHKPAAMLAVSPKGTVPVFVLADGQVLEESLDIMYWALSQTKDPVWTKAGVAAELITRNDTEFKYFLDRYKYADRYAQHPPLFYRQQAELFLSELERILQAHPFLSGVEFGFSDAAILPFIRQFAAVDADWFAGAPYSALRNLLNDFVQSALFVQIMHKYPVWEPSSTVVI